MSLYIQHTSSSMNQSTETIEMLDDGVMTGMSEDEEDEEDEEEEDEDDDDEGLSSPDSSYEGDMMQVSLDDDVANQLAAAGPVGVAAAAAIASAKKRKRPHSFETNPSIRKRQQNRLLRKLRQTIYEFATRVGQQAVVLVATPGKPNTSYKVFGAKPLEDVVKNLKSIVMEELESALAQQAPPPLQEDPTLFELPPLIIDGIPTPVEKMTQAQLRAFIPLMLKYSTGRGKPGWGRESTRPSWWPKALPWANVRMDARNEDDKQKISWTHALRKIVINCYKFHGREDLLPAFSEEDEKANQITACVASATSAAYTQTMIHSIQNPDGSVSIIQVDPNNQIITLPDGTTAQVQGVATLHTSDGNNQVHSVQSVESSTHNDNMTVDLTEATLSQDGQLIIQGDDGHGYPVSVSGMITLPVSSSVYQTMVANIQQLHSNSDGTLCITPMQVQKSLHHSPDDMSLSSVNSSTAAISTTTPTQSVHVPNNNIHHIHQQNHQPHTHSHHNHHHHHHGGHHMFPYAGNNVLGSSWFGLNGVAAGGVGGANVFANQLKLNRAMLQTMAENGVNLKNESLIKSFQKHFGRSLNNMNNNNNNNNELTASNDCLPAPAVVPKAEFETDIDNSHAVIDSDGNIIIRFGNSAPIKIECDSSDLHT